MEARTVRSSMLCLLFLLTSSGASITEKPPLEAISQGKTLNNRENQVAISSLMSTTQHDDIPIVNPTTPGTTTPIINPPSPLPPTTTEPTPTAPTTTTPAVPTTTTPVAPTTNGTPSPGGGAWCIAISTASQTALQVALDYACGYGGADCSAIQPSGTCYNPNTVRDHASYAFNDYYQKNPVPSSCSFGGTAQLTYTDPSSGGCHYASPRATPTTPPTPTMPTTPSTTSPAIPTTPGGPTVYGTEPGYGAEPMGEPSSADSTSVNLPLLFTTCLILSLAARWK